MLVACYANSIISHIIPLLGQDNRNRVQHDLFGHVHHWQWCQYHMTPKALSVASLHFLGQDEGNEVQHDFFGYVAPLTHVLTSCHASGSIVSGTIVFVRTKQMKQGALWLSSHMTPLVPLLASFMLAPSHLLGQDDWNEVQHDFLVMWSIVTSAGVTWHCHQQREKTTRQRWLNPKISAAV